MNENYSEELMKFERIIHLSDIHIRMNERHEEYRQCFNELYKKLETYDKNTSIIVITGDILNERTGLSAETIILCTEFLKRLASILKTVLIAGNHDGYLNSSQKIDIISGILYDKKIFNLYYLKYSGIYTFNNLTFGVSSIFEDNFIKAEQIYDVNQIKIALYHGSVGNFKLQNLMISKGEKTIEDFKGYDYVLLGDIHHHQYLNEEKTIAYASSLICQTYGEVGEHGYILWNLANKSSEYIKIYNEYDFKNGYLTTNNLKIDEKIFDLEDIIGIKEYLPKKGRLQIYREDTLENREKIKYLKNKLKNISIKEQDEVVLRKNEKEIRLKYEIDRKEIIRELLTKKYKKVEDETVAWIEEQLKNNDKIINNEYNTCEFLKLKFSNLFIYGENNEIDMLKYNTKDIILICGKNSYGKSSIIDIIIFNLYEEYARDIGNIKKSKSGILNNGKDEGWSELLIRIGETIYLIEKVYKRKKNEIETVGVIYRLDNMDDITIIHKNHKMNSSKVYEYNGSKYKLTPYLGGKSITKEIERLLGKKDNFMLINIMMQNDNISFKNKNQSERKKTLMQLLDLEKYEKIKKEVSSKFLEEKVKKEKLENITKDVDIINLEGESKIKELEIEILKDSIVKYNEQLNIIIKNKEELMLNYTKIDEDKIKEEPKIKKEIEKIINENIINENKITKLKISITESLKDCENTMNLSERSRVVKELFSGEQSSYENTMNLSERSRVVKELFSGEQSSYENTKLRDNEKYNELNKELLQKLTEKKTLYETKNKASNIDIEINKLELNIKDIIEQEEIYQKIKEEYKEKCKDYNNKKEILNNILNVLEYEKENIKILDKKISKIKTEEELNILKDDKKILIENDEIEIGKIKDELEEIEKSIIQINESIEINSDVNELYIINDNKKRELQKIEDEMDTKIKLLNELETHEYNPECIQCMKNPKVIEMFNIKEDIKILNEKKELINIDETIDERKEIYEINKIELNKCYKNINDKGSKLKVLNENKINNEKYLVDVENKIKLIVIIDRINNERNNLDIDKLMEESENINKNMQIILKKIESKKDLENQLKDLENDKILIIKNNDMKEYNEKIENEIRIIKKVMEELKNKMKEDSDTYIKIKSINEIENEKKIKIILLEKLNKELLEINIQKGNIEENKLIKNKINELEIKVKEGNKENLSLEKELTKKEIEYNNLIININNYKENIGEIKNNEKIYKRWEYYNDVVDKNGIPLYIINKYLEIITKGINKIIGTIINKRIELYEMSDNIIINIYDHDNKIVDFLGGMETFILDISFKITLSKIMELSKCNFLFIDEGISSFDKDNLTNIEELFYFLNQHFDYIFLMSHIEQIKDYVSQKIIIKNEGGYSKITY